MKDRLPSGMIWLGLVFAATAAILSESLAWGGRPTESRDPVPMALVPGGPFLMGSSEGSGREDERPQRKVHVDAFAIDLVEVTNGRYLRFVDATGHRHPPNPYGNGALTNAKGIESLPIVQVNWHDAFDYCQWAGKRLPTEAEWEKAARGTEGRQYPWGDEQPSPVRANFERNWDKQMTLHPVGTLPEGVSPYGIHDLAGNAREWVSDWYASDYYQHAPDRNPRGPERGVLKVIRGGSWHSPLADITTMARGRGGFALRTHGTGFRCAKEVREASRGR